MTPNEYLDATKARLNLSSDYALAKALDIANGSLSGIKSGHRHIPLDVAFKIAITLEIDPAQVVADLEQQREKNAKRRGFWQSFTSRAACIVALICCTLALSLSGISGNGQAARGGAFRRLPNCA